jgi:hypothetical protein
MVIAISTVNNPVAFEMWKPCACFLIQTPGDHPAKDVRYSRMIRSEIEQIFERVSKNLIVVPEFANKSGGLRLLVAVHGNLLTFDV